MNRLTSGALRLQSRLLLAGLAGLAGLEARHALAAADGRDGATPGGTEAGQATAEYALVLLGAAAIALLVVSWATRTNVVGKLLDAVFGQLLGKSGSASR